MTRLVSRERTRIFSWSTPAASAIILSINHVILGTCCQDYATHQQQIDTQHIFLNDGIVRERIVVHEIIGC